MNVIAVLQRLNLSFDPKVRGGRVCGHCPYHEDKTPSWFVRVEKPRKGNHYCNSCHEGGSLEALVMHVLKMSRSEAREWIERDEVAVPVEAAPRCIRVDVQTQTDRAFRLPLGVVFAPLPKWIGVALSYAHERRLTDYDVDHWGLGYAVTGKLAGRLVVPIRGSMGEPRSYMARTFVGAPKRYLYPSLEEGYDPCTIFGEQWWPKPGMRNTVAVLEGAFKAIALHRVFPGLPVAVLGGSTISGPHASKITTFRAVLVMTDANPAGDDAARALRSVLGRIPNARVRLPKDADEMDPQEVRRFTWPALATLGEALSPAAPRP